MKVAVVGGGIAGLAAAWELSGHPGVTITVFEPDRLGGKLLTTEFAGRPVDEGPDAFLTRTPDATDLCRELGLDDLVSPAAGRTLLWTQGRLKPLPAGLVLGAPGRLTPIVKSGLLSPLGMARAAADLVLPKRSQSEDLSVGELITARFGREVSSTLVEPLLGSIHAAPIDLLSATLTAPQLLSTAQKSRSLLLGLRRMHAAMPALGGPLFLAPVGGMGRIAERLVDVLRLRGVTIRPSRVKAISSLLGSVLVTTNQDGGDEVFDGVIVAITAPAAFRLIRGHTPCRLAEIDFTSVALATFAIDRKSWTPPPEFNGFLVPRTEGRLTTACSFFSNKWPDQAAGPHILRVSAGSFSDRRIQSISDKTLIATLESELRDATRANLHYREARLRRWPQSFPLYRVGHADTVRSITSEMGDSMPRIALAGSSYGGAGVPACVKSGRDAARQIMSAVGHG